MQMDKMITVQQQVFNNCQLPAYTQNPYPELSSSTQSTVSTVPNGAIMYPDLADFMGLELSQQMIAANMPEYLSSNRTTAVRSEIEIKTFSQKSNYRKNILECKNLKRKSKI